MVRKWLRNVKCQQMLVPVFSKFDSSDILLVDEVGGDGILGWVVPRAEDFFPEEESPGGVPLLGSLLFGILLALTDGVHHVVTSATKGGHFVEESDVKRKPELKWIYVVMHRSKFCPLD